MRHTVRRRTVLLVASTAVALLGCGSAATRVEARSVAAESAPIGRTSWESAPLDWGVETPVVSNDGRWVAFQSSSRAVVPGDTGGFRQIYLWDLLTDIVTRISVAPDGVTAGDSNSGYPFDPTVQEQTRGVTYDPPSISEDGRYVAFQSEAANLVAGDTNRVRDVFVYDRQAAADERIARVSVDSSGAQANRASRSPSLWCARPPDPEPALGPLCEVAFASTATNLVPVPPGDGAQHIYRRGKASGEGWNGTNAFTQQVDVDHACPLLVRAPSLRARSVQASAISLTADRSSPSVSPDGESIAFSAVVAGRSNSSIVLWNVCNDLTQVTNASAGDSTEPVVVGKSGSNVTVLFTSRSRDLGTTDPGPGTNVYRAQARVGTGSVSLDRLSVDARSGAGVSRNPVGRGQIAAFVATPDDHPEGVLVVRITDVGAFRPPIAAGVAGIRTPSLAVGAIGGGAVARIVAATGDTSSSASRLVSVDELGPSGGLGPSFTTMLRPARTAVHPDLSEDGRWVAFASEAPDLVAGDADGTSDVFVRNIDTDQTELVSVPPPGRTFNGAAQPSISADGRHVVFAATIDNARGVPSRMSADGEVTGGIPGPRSDIFVRDRLTGTTELVTIGYGIGLAGVVGAPSSGVSLAPDISADGSQVAFESTADNLWPDGARRFDSDLPQVFVRDRRAGRTSLLSAAWAYDDSAAPTVPSTVRWTGLPDPDTASYEPVISSDGRFVAFTSTSEQLVPDGAYRCATDPVVTRVSPSVGMAGGGERVVLRGANLSSVTSVTFGGVGATDLRVVSDDTLEVTTPPHPDGAVDVVAIAPDPTPPTPPLPDPPPVTSVAGPASRYRFTSGAPDPAAAPPAFLPVANNCPSSSPVDGYEFGGDNGAADVFLVDRDPSGAGSLDGGALIPDPAAGAIRTSLVSVAPTGDRLSGGRALDSGLPAIARTPDAAPLVAFTSNAAGVVAGVLPAGVAQVYVRDTAGAGRNELISRNTSGDAADRPATQSAISANGRFVAFASAASNLVDGDGAAADVFVRDRVARLTVVASVTSNPTSSSPAEPPKDETSPADETGAREPAMDRLGRRVGFQSDATNFDPADGDGIDDVYVRTWLPDLVVDPDPVDLGDAKVGTESLPRPVVVVNRGFGPAHVTGDQLAPADLASFPARPPTDACAAPGRYVYLGERCDAAAHVFAPAERGRRAATVTVLTDDPLVTVTGTLVGRGVMDDPPPDTTSTTTTTTTAPRRATTTTTTTIPAKVEEKVELPPGVLRITPDVTPAGRVVQVVGTGFEPGTIVTLRWSRGMAPVIGVLTDAAGSFTTGVLILPGELPGRRTLTAATTGSPSDDVLVVRGTVHAPKFVDRG